MDDGPKSLLIVDDDEDIRTNFRDILDEHGYQVDVACDGPSALELVRMHCYDVVLLDFKMPGMDGAALYRKIKEICPETAAIMVTAYAGSTGAQEALDAGTWKVLRKPVDVPELLDVLKQASQAPVVLLVDDDQDFCQNLWQLLGEQHIRVALAHCEDLGSAKAISGQFDVALVDLHLGAGNGRKVLEHVRQTNPDTKTILVTGYREEAEQFVQDVGTNAIDAICFKPIDVAGLLEMIKAKVG
jgi:DNA-binding NtrC family response regulator